MKTSIFFKSLPLMAAAALCFPLSLTSCSDDNEVTTPPERHWTTDGGLRATDNLLFDNNTIGNGDKELVFNGKQTLKKGTYTLKGWVYVAAGAELTIEPGTVIRGDKQTKSALIVERGGKLIAEGTASQPIVFTSGEAKGQRKPGDWGGLILCGKAPNNAGDQQIEGGPRSHHGGTDAADNSGVLSYVRIEFAGYPFETDKEINGLTLGSVGSGTRIDHVQVSYSNDDSFEWFGGTGDCRHLVAFNVWDDDFDTDNGFSGRVQFGLSVRHPQIADKSQSNSFESDNDANGSTAAPFTSAVFSNITMIGPKAVDEKFQNSTDYINGGDYFPNNGSGMGKFQSAMQIRRGSRLNCYNSVAIGWPIGLIIDGEKGDTPEQAAAGTMKMQGLWFAGMDITGSDKNKSYEDKQADGTTPSRSTLFFNSWGNHSVSAQDLLRSGAGSITGLNANFMPTAASPLCTGADFKGLDSWFTAVSYAGAFSPTDNWLKGWTNFDPNHTDY